MKKIKFDDVTIIQVGTFIAIVVLVVLGNIELYDMYMKSRDIDASIAELNNTLIIGASGMSFSVLAFSIISIVDLFREKPTKNHESKNKDLKKINSMT